MGDSARRHAEKYGNLKLPRQVEVDRSKMTIGVSTKCVIGLPTELRPRFPEGRFRAEVSFVGKEIQFLLKPDASANYKFMEEARRGQNFVFLPLNAVHGLGPTFPKFGKTPVRSAVWTTSGLRLTLPEKLQPRILRGKVRKKTLEKTPLAKNNTIGGENTVTDRYDVPANLVADMRVALSKSLKVVVPPEVGKRLGEVPVRVLLTRNNGNFQITMAPTDRAKARLSERPEGYVTSPARNTIGAAPKWKFRRVKPESARWQGDALIITLPETLQDPIIRRRKRKGEEAPATKPETKAPTPPPAQPQALRDVTREQEIPAISLRQAVRAINAFKDAEPDNLVLSVDKDGKLEAMVRYY